MHQPVPAADYYLVFGELVKETRSIKYQYAKLAAATKRSLKLRRVLPEQLLAALEPEIAKECKPSSSIPDIFASLCSHMSFFDYELLEQIILKFEDQNVLKKLDDYKKAIDSYCKNPLRQLPPNSLTNMDQNHRGCKTSVKIKLDAEWNNATLADIRGFRQKFAAIFEIKEELLNLCSVEKGCILTNFHVHTSICLLYTSPSPRDATLSRMPSSA